MENKDVNEMLIPLEGLELLNSEMFFIMGGNKPTDQDEAGSGPGCGCGCGCGC